MYVAALNGRATSNNKPENESVAEYLRASKA